MYNLLCISGGGVRGMQPATYLVEIEKRTPRFVEAIDLIAGTSTGGLIALALAAGFDGLYIQRMYLEKAQQIFSRSFWRALTSLWGLIGAKYDNDGLRKILEEMFPAGLRLGDLKKRVLVPCFRLDSTQDEVRLWEPVFFHNEPDSPYLDELVVDVALRTTAAPTYFPSYQGYIDGGVATNSPVVAAIAHAVARGHSTQDLVVAHLGTGYTSKYIERDRLDWGKLQWAPRIADLMIDANRMTNETHGRQLLTKRPGERALAAADLTQTIAAFSQALFEQFPRIPDHELLVVATLSWNLPIYQRNPEKNAGAITEILRVLSMFPREVQAVSVELQEQRTATYGADGRLARVDMRFDPLGNADMRVDALPPPD